MGLHKPRVYKVGIEWVCNCICGSRVELDYFMTWTEAMERAVRYAKGWR